MVNPGQECRHYAYIKSKFSLAFCVQAKTPPSSGNNNRGTIKLIPRALNQFRKRGRPGQRPGLDLDDPTVRRSFR